jgi:predicted transposase YdaD
MNNVTMNLPDQKTTRDMEHRLQIKWGLTRRLYERGYSRKEVLELYRLIDWLMMLPEGLALEFRRTMVQYEEEHKMPYITSIEQIGIEKGRQEGRQEERLSIVLRLIRRRFGILNLELENRIRALDAICLEQLAEDLLDFKSLADLTTWLNR